MKIKIKVDNKFKQVEVLDKQCRKRKCLIIGRYTHHSACGLSGCSSWSDDNYSCLTRDNRGCPDIKE